MIDKISWRIEEYDVWIRLEKGARTVYIHMGLWYVVDLSKNYYLNPQHTTNSQRRMPIEESRRSFARPWKYQDWQTKLYLHV